MSNVHSLEEVLLDTAALVDVATKAGISTTEAKRVCAALADLPIVQAIRICTTARADQVRQINRQTRRTHR